MGTLDRSAMKNEAESVEIGRNKGESSKPPAPGLPTKTVTPAEFEAFKAWTIQQLALAQPAAATDSFIQNGPDGDGLVADGRGLIAEPGFSGNGWAYGKRVTGITQTDGYIKGDRTAQTAAWDVGPPPDPWGENDDWRKISDIIGDFYIP